MSYLREPENFTMSDFCRLWRALLDSLRQILFRPNHLQKHDQSTEAHSVRIRTGFGKISGFEQFVHIADLSNCSEATGSLDLSMLSRLHRFDLSHYEQATNEIDLSSSTNMTDMKLLDTLSTG